MESQGVEEDIYLRIYMHIYIQKETTGETNFGLNKSLGPELHLSSL